MYASTTWGTALQFHSVVNSVRATQRKSNTLCARAYRGVRYAVTTVLAGMPPLDLTIEKRNISYSYRRKYFPIMWCRLAPFEIRRSLTIKALESMLDQRILEAWNEMYVDSVPENNWCRVLIPSVEWAIVNIEARPNFMLSQAITGHGAFNAYLFRIVKRTSPTCKCGLADQTPEHLSLIHI